MNEARLAVKLVERYGLTTKQAMKVVLESDADGASKMMAANAAPDDPKKQKELASKYKEQMKQQMAAAADAPKDEVDDKDEPKPEGY